MNKLTTIAKGETLNKSTTIDAEAKTARVIGSVKGNDDDIVRYVTNWTFDFASASQEQIMRLATASIVIIQQGKFRAAVKAGGDWDNNEAWGDVVFDVANIMATVKRQPKSKIEKASTLLNDMSPADLELLQAKITAQQTARKDAA